jgi:hypothetical protein
MGQLSNSVVRRALGPLGFGVVVLIGWGALAVEQLGPAAASPDRSIPAMEVEAEREIHCPPNLKQRLKPLSQIRADISLSPGPRPMDCTGPVFDVPADAPTGRWTPTEFQWCPTNFHLCPPYFEDTPLERYGQTPCPALQPVFSTAHFFTALTTLPYQMLVNRPCEPVYTLGFYRPGSPTPCLRQGLPCPSDPPCYRTTRE